MKPRILGRILFSALVVLLLAGIGVLLVFSHWRSERMVALAAGSQIVPTALGPVEVAIRGEGSPLLVFHGAPGGYDQGVLLGQAFVDQGFEIIAPSRPGYLRTPLASGLFPAQEADLMAALLDYEKIPRVAVLAFSSGGPAAIEFALRHPDRISALILISAVNQKYDNYHHPDLVQAGAQVWSLVRGDFGSWLVTLQDSSSPRPLIASALAATLTAEPDQQTVAVDAVLNDPAWLAAFRRLLDTFFPIEARQLGEHNDIFNERILPDYPWSRLTVPTLVVHGPLDRLVPFVQAQAVAAAIPGARLFSAEGAGHLITLSPSLLPARQAVIEFLEQHRP